jgi:ribosome biogenesis GTPase A
MKKAVGIIEENLKLVDAVLYVLDARAPYACINPEFDRVLKDKPRLYVINKSDLVDESSVKAWVEFFRYGADIAANGKANFESDAKGNIGRHNNENIKSNAEQNGKGNTERDDIKRNAAQSDEKNAEPNAKGNAEQDNNKNIKLNAEQSDKCNTERDEIKGNAEQDNNANIKLNAEQNDKGNTEENAKGNAERDEIKGNAAQNAKCNTAQNGTKTIASRSFQSRCVALNSATGVTSGVVRELRLLLDEKIRRYLQKGVKKTLRVMVVGIPNSGKSTLINGVGGKKKTATGDRPGVTKSKQWVNIGEGIELLDTPGALPPRLDDQDAAKDLFFIGSIKQDIFDNVGLSLTLVEKLRKIAPKSLKDRYKIEISDAVAPLEIFENIAKSRGYVVKGGETDTERTATMILDDFKKTRIGRICLEKPPAY